MLGGWGDEMVSKESAKVRLESQNQPVRLCWLPYSLNETKINTVGNWTANTHGNPGYCQHAQKPFYITVEYKS